MHWEQVYENKKPTEVSWFQAVPDRSLQMVRETGIAATDPILDAGGGASTLVDNLLTEGFGDITVLDISAAALARSRDRLGDRADSVTWVESDVTEFEPGREYVLWHDRAVFHFLTEAEDRMRYVDIARRALRSGGHLLLATFGPEGPLRCSGLEICRYGIDDLRALFGEHFELRRHEIEEHRTPGGATQQFLYTWWQRKG